MGKRVRNAWVLKRMGVEVRSGEAVCEVGLGCGEDVDDEVDRG